MKTNLNSSAPHLYAAAEWQPGIGDKVFILYRSPDGAVEAGLRRWQASTDFDCERDFLCYFQRGRGSFCRDSGELISVAPGTVVHFKQGYRGALEIFEPIEASFMMCAGGPAAHTPILHDVLTAAPLKDWGAIPTMIAGTSFTAGILLSREAGGRAESGIWTCTPGVWQCEVTSDEYCHFLDGSCTYMHENGERIDIAPDTLAFFPRGWKGICDVRRTLRKVYLIR